MSFKLKIQNIVSQVFDELNSQVILNNYTEGYPDGDFDVSSLEHKVFTLKHGNTFSESIFNHLSGLPEDCTFLHIYAYQTVESPLEIPSPLKFQLVMVEEGSDSTGINIPIFVGKMSEFRLVNAEKFNCAIHVRNVEVPIGKTCNVVVLAGFKAV
jgi:hypothetical protein